MSTLRGKLWLLRVALKLKKAMSAGKDKKKKNEAGGFEITKDMMQMIGGFTVIRITSLVGAMNLKFTKEQLLKMNKQLNRIRKPKNK